MSADREPPDMNGHYTKPGWTIPERVITTNEFHHHALKYLRIVAGVLVLNLAASIAAAVLALR